MSTEIDRALVEALERIAKAVERLAAATPAAASDHPERDACEGASAFIWQPLGRRLKPVRAVSRVALDLLRGIDDARDRLRENTWRFAEGLPANNALLWGARGMGKSSLIKAVHAEVNKKRQSADVSPDGLKLVEIHREDIETLPTLMDDLRARPDERFIVFCDDLSFDGGDTSYKSLKAALEGGLEGRAPNTLFYATSNRRHLLAREMAENQIASAVNPSDAVQESVSLSDRFGLWLGFHNCSQEGYLDMVTAYAEHFGLIDDLPPKMRGDKAIKRQALLDQAGKWALARGGRSGRVAWQFIQELAGGLGVRIP